MPDVQLNINDLHERHVGLTPALGTSFSEAASVCFSRHHLSPVQVAIRNAASSCSRSVEFLAPDERTSAAWANVTDTTESGAYGVSLAAIESEEGLIAVGRAETLTGADWYVAPVGSNVGDFEECFRLEVSGTDAGDEATVQARLKQKLEQARKGKSNLPAIASVVGFKEKLIAISRMVTPE